MSTSRFVVVGLVLACILMCVGVTAIVGALTLPLNSSLLSQFANTQPVDSNSLPAPAVGLKTGQTAPDFALKGLDQQTVQLNQFRGRPVMVNFWATWCGPCSAEMPNIEKEYQLHKSDVVILAVNQDESADQVRGYADLYHLNFPLLLDDRSAVGGVYRVQALPTTVFIDRNGSIREVHIGGPMSTDFIEERLQSLLK